MNPVPLSKYMYPGDVSSFRRWTRRHAAAAGTVPVTAAVRGAGNENFRIIGMEGRITIPWAIRQKAGFRPDDVVSFQLMEDDSVLVRRESTCGKEKNPGAGRDAAIKAFLDSLDEKQRYSALVHLSVLWAQSHDNPKRGELE